MPFCTFSTGDSHESAHQRNPKACRESVIPVCPLLYWSLPPGPEIPQGVEIERDITPSGLTGRSFRTECGTTLGPDLASGLTGVRCRAARSSLRVRTRPVVMVSASPGPPGGSRQPQRRTGKQPIRARPGAPVACRATACAAPQGAGPCRIGPAGPAPCGSWPCSRTGTMACGRRPLIAARGRPASAPGRILERSPARPRLSNSGGGAATRPRGQDGLTQGRGARDPWQDCGTLSVRRTLDARSQTLLCGCRREVVSGTTGRFIARSAGACLAGQALSPARVRLRNAT